jgi:hypothetical protein
MASDLDDIAQRNSLRRDAGLPRLDEAAELKKLESIRFEAAFEREFERNRPRMNHLWADKKMGGLSRMGLWNKARADVRNEMSQRVVGKH